MNFSTKVPIQKTNFPIDYQSDILLLGSCFAENMGEKFQYFKFKTAVNPFGIIFNPVSIEKLIWRVVNQEKFTENDIFFHNEMWHCFEVHSELSNSDKEDFLRNLNEIIDKTHFQISQLSHLQITYGTSWVYRNIASKQIVANCHKVAQKDFTKELLLAETIEKSIQNTVDLIQKVNSNCTFIFTISPGRHIKDGFFENNVSKGNLFSALNKIIKNENCKLNTEYFPSYEILIDELRDYRFYTNDMLHPSQVAIDYIWERFSENYFSNETHAIMQQIDDIRKAINHKPLNSDSKSYALFKENIKNKLNQLKERYPFIKL